MAKQRQYITAFTYDKRGKLISKGECNYVKTHPLQAKMANGTDNPHRIYLHAEIDAIIKARGQKIHSMVITRIKNNGEFGNAAPCECCQKAIKLFNIKHVEHT